MPLCLELNINSMNKASVIKVGDSNVTLSKEVKILGVHLDPTLSMDVQVNSIVSSCNFHIRALRHIRNRLTLESVKAVACGLVLSRIDYCNSILYGTSAHNIAKLQIVQNDLARAVLQLPRRASATQALKELHWLPVAQRIKHKVATLTYTVRHTSQPAYLQELITDCSYTHTKIIWQHTAG